MLVVGMLDLMAEDLAPITSVPVNNAPSAIAAREPPVTERPRR